MIQCIMPDGTIKGTYIGCGNHLAEYNAKKHQPPPKMRKDVERHKPYEDFFRVTLLEQCATDAAMHAREAHYIKTYNGTGTRGKGGYNTLASAPHLSAQYIFLRNTGRLSTQQRPRSRGHTRYDDRG